MLVSIINQIVSIIFNKSFLLGILFTSAVLSKYIFGNDNLFEDIVEVIYYHSSGEKVDFSPEIPNESVKTSIQHN